MSHPRRGRVGVSLAAIALLTGAAAVTLPVIDRSKAGAAGAPGTVTIDAATELGRLNRNVAGVVMEFNIRDDTPDSIAEALAPPVARYATHPHNFGNRNMPLCWSEDDPHRFAIVDQELRRAAGFGIDPARIHVQLIYIPPPTCFVPAAEQRAQYASISAATILLEPERVKDMLHDQITHLALVNGIRMFGVWNEPDGIFPMAPDAYNAFFHMVHDQLRRVESENPGLRLRIAGPESSHPDELYIGRFLDYVVANGLRLDRLTYHDYSGTKGQEPTPAAYAANFETVRGFAAARGLTPEIYLDEWAYDVSSANEINRDGAGAAYVASTLTTFADIGLSGATYFNWQDRIEGGFADDAGALRYGLLDVHHKPRPPHHAFRLFRALGDTRVQATPVSQTVTSRQEWGALATRADDGSLRVLLRNWDPRKSGGAILVDFDISGFTAASWTAEAVGLSTGGIPELSSGLGSPVIELPQNQVVLVSLQPGQPHAGRTL